MLRPVRIAPITKSIKTTLVSRNQLIELYTLFSESPQTRGMWGTLFEAIGLCVVPEGLEITLLPIVKFPRRLERPRWYTSHATQQNSWQSAKKHCVRRGRYESLLPRFKDSRPMRFCLFARVFSIFRSRKSMKQSTLSSSLTASSTSSNLLLVRANPSRRVASRGTGRPRFCGILTKVWHSMFGNRSSYFSSHLV